MGARLRRSAPSCAIALAAVAVMSWLGLYGFAWTDYDNEAAPAFRALVGGHVTRFLQLLPAYGGSLELRAPFALLPGLFGGGELAVYRLVALPCLLAGAALGVWLVGRMRADGRSRLARTVALGLCVANPLTLRALELGHPEELLGAVLCVAAVLVASRGRPIWAGLLLGLAIANKPWALLAVGPVLLALRGPGRVRLTALVVAGAVAAALLTPMLIFHSPGASPAGVAVATQTGVIFQPEQVYWFAGQAGHVVRGLDGLVKPGYRTPPSWLGGLAHPLIVLIAIPLTLLCLRRRRPHDALLLLALLLLLRCVLDPWDAVYYPLPFVLALLAWETAARREPPVGSLAASALVWAIWEWLPAHAGADLISAASMAVALPAVLALGVALYRRPQPAAHAAAHARSSFSRRSPAPS
jgi:hypothetical protein